MKIGRKEALFALVSGLIPWVATRARAQSTLPPAPIPSIPNANFQLQITALQTRIAALETAAANQVAFTKSGNDLTLTAPGNVTIKGSGTCLVSAANVNLQGSAMLTAQGTSQLLLKSNSTVSVSGPVVAVAGQAMVNVTGGVIKLN
jgi:hypothetical protein